MKISSIYDRCYILGPRRGHVTKSASSPISRSHKYWWPEVWHSLGVEEKISTRQHGALCTMGASFLECDTKVGKTHKCTPCLQGAAQLHRLLRCPRLQLLSFYVRFSSSLCYYIPPLALSYTVLFCRWIRSSCTISCTSSMFLTLNPFVGLLTMENRLDARSFGAALRPAATSTPVEGMMLISSSHLGDCTKDLYYLLRFLFSRYQYYQYY
jgi:hypothetical protein